MKKFKSIVMNVCGFTALLLSSAAVAAPTYTVAWYANPCITNVTYSASAVFAGDEHRNKTVHQNNVDLIFRIVDALGLFVMSLSVPIDEHAVHRVIV